jgi:hypothetical protein
MSLELIIIKGLIFAIGWSSTNPDNVLGLKRFIVASLFLLNFDDICFVSVYDRWSKKLFRFQSLFKIRSFRVSDKVGNESFNLIISVKVSGI